MAAQPGNPQRSNLEAFIEAGIISEEDANNLETQRRNAIDDMPQYVVEMLIALYNEVGPVAGSFLI